MLIVRNIAVGSTLLLALTLQAANTGKTAATYAKDVAPILFKNCASCHRPGEGAPMSLLDYQSTRPWAKSIKQAVVAKVMPPWLADPKYGHFANDRRLKQTEIDTIVSWVDAGAPRGNVADMPAAPKFVEGWQLGKPDVVFEMPAAFEVPAEGVIPYKYFSVPTGFTEDKWVRGVEVRAGSPSEVHHIIVTLSDAGTTGDVRRPGDAERRRQHTAGDVDQGRCQLSMPLHRMRHDDAAGDSAGPG